MTIVRLALVVESWSETDDGEIEFRLTISLYSFWYLRGSFTAKAGTYLERAAARAGERHATQMGGLPAPAIGRTGKFAGGCRRWPK